MSALIYCTNCRQPYPPAGAPYRCPECGGHFDAPQLPDFCGVESDRTSPGGLPGIWRYRASLGLPAGAPVVSLGEGNTPLVWGKAFGKDVAFKLEFLNPTGSYKDRGAAVIASFLKQRGAQQAVEDSSGNAGASFAAYAARAGMQARVYMPDYASGPKRRQIEVYGADAVSVPGTRSDTAEAVLKAVEQGAFYGSHAYLPFGLFGYATIAYELLEQIGAAPGTIIAPAGQGNLLLAIGRGFQALLRAGLISHMPRLVGVQARACAPLWAAFNYGPSGLAWVVEGETLAEGVRVRRPVRGDALIRLVGETDGTMVAVDEDEILPARDELARQGLYVEPTSALVWSALRQVHEQMPAPLAVVLTGSGLKSPL